MLYAITTTTAKVRLDGHTDRIRGEFAAVVALNEIGCEADAAVKIEFRRTGKDRWAKPHEEPTLPGYVFADVPEHLFFEAARVRPIYGPMMAIPRNEVPNVTKWLDARSAARTEALRIADNRVAMAEYEPGDDLELLSTAFRGQLGRFKQMVHRAWSQHPTLIVDTDLGPVEVDPLDVKRAG